MGSCPCSPDLIPTAPGGCGALGRGRGLRLAPEKRSSERALSAQRHAGGENKREGKTETRGGSCNNGIGSDLDAIHGHTHTGAGDEQWERSKQPVRG